MSGTNAENFPYFPPELEREIFETTAMLHPEMAPVLMRVAHRLLSWCQSTLQQVSQRSDITAHLRIEPFLYRVVVVVPGLDKRPEDTALVRMMEEKPGNFLANSVRHMWVDIFPPHFPPTDQWSAAEFHKLLRSCTGVTDLLVIGYVAEFLPHLTSMQPTRLATYAAHRRDGILPALDFTLPFFQRITHLLLFDFTDDSLWPKLRSLPALTHLAISGYGKSWAIPTILSELSTLQILVALSQSGGEMISQYIPTDDLRVVVMPFDGMPYDDCWTEWELGIRGRDDFWARAEALLLRKLTGAIESCIRLDSRGDLGISRQRGQPETSKGSVSGT
ncbi:hypothetical protein B0H11DRAFT_2335449 [Mycena galericulata]|nr:hypothetical protein B0H11DRAFT_2335449 [Mycena galericulata]